MDRPTSPGEGRDNHRLTVGQQRGELGRALPGKFTLKSLPGTWGVPPTLFSQGAKC